MKGIISLTICSTVFVLSAASSISLGSFPLFQDDPNSCVGRCNRTGTIPNGCQCNTACVTHNDCCADYYTLCLGGGSPNSCAGKCGDTYVPSHPCHCNDRCLEFGNCCPDYSEECGGSADPITNAELEALAEEFYALEGVNPNSVAGYVTWDLQGRTTQGSTVDMAPNPLLTVNPIAYTIGTTALLVSLFDNYNPTVTVPETESIQETAEINAFLDTILATPIMSRLSSFLSDKGVTFDRNKFKEMWFGLYARGGSALGSSGLEHVFLAELNNGVSGFHNWVFFAKEEEAGNLNYRGWMKFLDMDKQGGLIQHNFVWRNANKPISSMFLATTPEFEIAVYTLCWLTRPNSQTCPALFNGNPVKVATFTIGSSSQFVGSAYADPL